MPESSKLKQTAHLFSVISNPVRLAVLVALQENGSLSAGGIQQVVGAEASLLSHHLRLLKEAALVAVEARGRQRFYELKDHHVAHIVRDALAHVSCNPDSD